MQKADLSDPKHGTKIAGSVVKIKFMNFKAFIYSKLKI
jgi:hypothetical protein